MPLHAAFALVLGANLGTAVNPLLEGEGGAGRRLAVGNLVNRLVGVGLALAALDWIGPWLVTVQPDPSRAVADFHTGFSMVLALVFLPVLGPAVGLPRRWLRTGPTPRSRCTWRRRPGKRRRSRWPARRGRRCGWRTCWTACCTVPGTLWPRATATR